MQTEGFLCWNLDEFGAPGPNMPKWLVLPGATGVKDTRGSPRGGAESVQSCLLPTNPRQPTPKLLGSSLARCHRFGLHRCCLSTSP